ncbi:MAG: hypothetical protein FWD27_03570 [Coriobacteriia bacterium]|nr:hypothetical protein [Coriobacteriia bacterium]
MAQRNPMNDRYTGEGPQGKTRKSAAKLKPKTDAASSVHIAKKPTNKQERKAARKKRDAQLAAKERERKRKAEERERKAREALGETIEEPKPATVGSKIKNFFLPPREDKGGKALKDDAAKDASVVEEKGEAAAQAGAAKSTTAKGAGSKGASAPPVAKIPTWRRGPDTPEYRKLKYIYYGLLGGGILFVTISLIINFWLPDAIEGYSTLIPLAVAYPAVIAALVLDNTKIRKMQRAHMAGDQGRQSPKQQKHAQQQAEAAALLEESKKAQRELKRTNSKNPFVKSKTKSK